MDDPQSPPDPVPVEPTNDKEKGAVKRRDQHLEEARKLLVGWRASTYRARYPYAIWGVEGLMPDVVVTALATYRRWRSLEDLQYAAADWMWKERHADEVLKLLKELDERVDAEKEFAKRAKADARKAETKRKREAKKRASEHVEDSLSSSDEEPLLALVERAPKRPRASRSHETTRPSTPSPPASPLPLTSSLPSTSTAGSKPPNEPVRYFPQLTSIITLIVSCLIHSFIRRAKRHPCCRHVQLYPPLAV